MKKGEERGERREERGERSEERGERRGVKRSREERGERKESREERGSRRGKRREKERRKEGTYFDWWFPGDVGNEKVHCNVLTVHPLVHHLSDLLRHPVTV